MDTSLQVMQGGKIVQRGKFDELLQRKKGFKSMVGAHSQALESVMNADNSSGTSSDNQKLADIEDEFNTEKETDDQLQGITKQGLVQNVSQDISDKRRLTQDEEREKGSIGTKVYWTYLRAVYGGALVPVIIAAQLLFQIFQIASNFWIRPPLLCVYSTIYGKCTMYLRPHHGHVTYWFTNIRKVLQKHDLLHPACPSVL